MACDSKNRFPNKPSKWTTQLLPRFMICACPDLSSLPLLGTCGLRKDPRFFATFGHNGDHPHLFCFIWFGSLQHLCPPPFIMLFCQAAPALSLLFVSGMRRKLSIPPGGAPKREVQYVGLELRSGLDRIDYGIFDSSSLVLSSGRAMRS